MFVYMEVGHTFESSSVKVPTKLSVLMVKLVPSIAVVSVVASTLVIGDRTALFS